MLPRTVILWLIPLLGLAYTPPPQEILSRMETTLRNSAPVVVDIVRENPDGAVIRERSIRIPAESRADLGVTSGQEISFSLFTLPKEEMVHSLGSLFSAGVPVSLVRIRGSVCYYLDGGRERLWLRKSDFTPVKTEIFSPDGGQVTCLYLDFISLSDHLRYPSRTEVYRDGDIAFVERLVSPSGDTDLP